MSSLLDVTDVSTSVRVTLARRTMAGDWTEEEILLQAQGRSFKVFQRHPQHAALRQRCRSMQKRGLLRFLCEDRGALYYRAAK